MLPPVSFTLEGVTFAIFQKNGKRKREICGNVTIFLHCLLPASMPSPCSGSAGCEKLLIWRENCARGRSEMGREKREKGVEKVWTLGIELFNLL